MAPGAWVGKAMAVKWQRLDVTNLRLLLLLLALRRGPAIISLLVPLGNSLATAGLTLVGLEIPLGILEMLFWL